MSFRLFIYYCALCGGAAALLGWSFGRQWETQDKLLEAGLRGLFLGMLVAFGLGLVDALWELGGRRWGLLLLRVIVAIVVGCLGGLGGGTFGQWLYGRTEWAGFLILGWTITGLLVGVSL